MDSKKFWADMTEEERAAWMEENKEWVEELAQIEYLELDVEGAGDGAARDSGTSEGSGSW